MNNFELDVLAELLKMSELKGISLSLTSDSEIVDYTGSGYFLTIKDPILPTDRVVLDRPKICGNLGGVSVGYVAFVEDSELTLECFSYGEEILPHHREQGFLRDAT